MNRSFVSLDWATLAEDPQWENKMPQDISGSPIFPWETTFPHRSSRRIPQKRFNPELESYLIRTKVVTWKHGQEANPQQALMMVREWIAKAWVDPDRRREVMEAWIAVSCPSEKLEAMPSIGDIKKICEQQQRVQELKRMLDPNKIRSIEEAQRKRRNRMQVQPGKATSEMTITNEEKTFQPSPPPENVKRDTEELARRIQLINVRNKILGYGNKRLIIASNADRIAMLQRLINEGDLDYVQQLINENIAWDLEVVNNEVKEVEF